MARRPNLGQLLAGLDLTEIFKEKGHGDIRRWSARRTIGGVIVATACADITANGVRWESVALCAIGVLPLIVSLKMRGGPPPETSSANQDRHDDGDRPAQR